MIDVAEKQMKQVLESDDCERRWRATKYFLRGAVWDARRRGRVDEDDAPRRTVTRWRDGAESALPADSADESALER